MLTVYLATTLIGSLSRMRDGNGSVTLRGAVLVLRWLVIFLF